MEFAIVGFCRAGVLHLINQRHGLVGDSNTQGQSLQAGKAKAGTASKKSAHNEHKYLKPTNRLNLWSQ